MSHEVVVVGGGIGGLTVAALLAARGTDVCVLERQSQVGGCVTNFETFEYQFEPTMGLYTCWGSGEAHQRIFSELPVEAPEARAVDQPVTRLSDGSEVAFASSNYVFEERLRQSFPECSEAAIEFYRQLSKIAEPLLQALRRVPDLPTASQRQRMYAFAPRVDRVRQLRRLKKRILDEELKNTSQRFREFIELQLRVFTAARLDDSAYLPSCALLHSVQQGLFAIRGGAANLAERLAESIQQSGGKVRLNSSVLRLSYDPSGKATGVDLLSGENLIATKAIVSNMTVWDTYGKLIGLQRTPPEIKKVLGGLSSPGAYLIHAGIDEDAANSLRSNHFLIANDSAQATEELIDPSRIGVAIAPEWDPRAPEGKRAATIMFSADVSQWFTFHSDVEEQEAKDQAALETGWAALHKRMPELGNAIEVIDTANPLTCYETTRRKLGMVGGIGLSPGLLEGQQLNHRTTLPNVFMVGDTVFPGAGIGAVSLGAFAVANEIAPR
ncbi:MAG: hypothetical protein C5B44_01895 [Acidobacteria bacterium]|nr:MAG: hypothetical protein C5B44_01895 [Acidobacteriota bacterium]